MEECTNTTIPQHAVFFIQLTNIVYERIVLRASIQQSNFLSQQQQTQVITSTVFRALFKSPYCLSLILGTLGVC